MSTHPLAPSRAPVRLAIAPTVGLGLLVPLALALLVLLARALLAPVARGDPGPRRDAPASHGRTPVMAPRAPAAAADFAIADSLGGAARAVAVSGDRAYAAIGARLVPVDISDPDAPVALGHGWQLDGMGDDIVVRGDVAYVLYRGTLQWLDLTRPEPQCCDNRLYAGNLSRGLAFDGAMGYTLSNSWDPLGASIEVIDFGQPLRPTVIARKSLQGYSCRAPAVANGHLYFACSYPAPVQIYDVSIPAAPDLVGEMDAGAEVVAMTAADGRLYLLTVKALRVLDLAAPTAPQELGRYELGKRPQAMAVGGNRVAILSESGNLMVLDVSDPAGPRLLGTVTVPGVTDHYTVSGLALAGEQVLVGAEMEGLRVVSVPDSGPAAVRGTVPTLGFDKVAVAGDTIYATSGSQLLLIDRSVPGAMAIKGQLSLPMTPRDITVRSGRAYILAGSQSGSQSLLVVDVQDSAAPVVLGRVALDKAGAHVAAAADDVVVVSGNRAGLQLVNTSDPAQPVVAGSLGSPTWAAWEAVGGGYAYIADATYGLRVVRIADPGDPIEVGGLPINRPDSLALAGNRLYLLALPGSAMSAAHADASAAVPIGAAASSAAPFATTGRSAVAQPAATAPPETEKRLVLVDAADPIRPQIEAVIGVASGWPWPTDLVRVEAHGNQAYVLYDWASGVWWQSVARFRSGQAAGEVALPAPYTSDMTAGDNALWVANWTAGLVEVASLGGSPVTPSPPAQRVFLPVAGAHAER